MCGEHNDVNNSNLCPPLHLLLRCYLHHLAASLRQPESTADITDYSCLDMDGARRHAKGGRLPRPVFNLASGTSFITSTQEDYETSPDFPRRVEIIQSGFEKPKLSSRKYPNRILAEVPGAHGGSRDPYLRAGF